MSCLSKFLKLLYPSWSCFRLHLQTLCYLELEGRSKSTYGHDKSYDNPLHELTECKHMSQVITSIYETLLVDQLRLYVLNVSWAFANFNHEVQVSCVASFICACFSMQYEFYPSSIIPLQPWTPLRAYVIH